MKILRFATAAGARLGVVRGDDIVSLEPLAGSNPTMRAVIEGGAQALDAVRALAAEGPAAIRLAEATLLAPIDQTSKYLAIGMNYQQHREEAQRAGVATPKKQLWFNKQTSCIVGPYDDIDPGVTEKLDYEAELGVVIGRGGKYISEQDAPAHVFGYFVANDVTARDWQFHTPTFTIGKSFDTHGPIGPWIVTADEVPDPHALMLRCLVNGAVRQECSTSEMIHNVWQQIAYLSSAFTLEPGDIIASGTPSGVGVAMEPPTFLVPGDVVRCEIDGIGAIENRVVASSAPAGWAASVLREEEMA